MRTALPSLLLIAAAGPAVAEAQTYQLDPVQVTANRTARTADASLAPVTVVTRDDIERLQPQSVVDILRLQPSVNLVRQGGGAGNVSLFLRGTESDHTLVLVDGVRASSATTGQFEWRNLDPAQIERIEIVRGPRAALYGSEAIGGVIQIFTRRPEGPTAQVEVGSHDTVRASVGSGGTLGALGYDFTVATERSDGIDATTAPTNPDRDGYEEHSLSGRLRYRVSEATSVGLSGWISEADNQYDEGEIHGRHSVLNLDLAQELAERWHHNVQLGYALDEQDTESAFPSEITTQRLSADWQHEYELTGSQLIIAGISGYQDRVENLDPQSGELEIDETIWNRAIYTSWLGNFGSQNLELALRRDDHENFGGHTTGSVAWGYDVSPDWRVSASYGTAFKAPTANELYHPGFFGTYAGNPDLQPEQSETAELGARWRFAPRQSLEAQLFYTEIEDLIDYDPSANLQANNIEQASIEGLELVYEGADDLWHWQASATIQRARDETDDSRLARRPDEQLALIVGRRVAAGQIQADALLVGDRVDSNDDRLAGYGLLGLSGSYPVTANFSITGRIDNLTDKDYTLAGGYNTPGRAYYVGVRYQPGAN